MKKIITDLKYFLKLIRWFHELLGLFPFVALYFIINYYAHKDGLSFDLSSTHFFILCIAVQLLMIAGFILNDIIDRDIDKINKPNTHIVGNTISLKTSKLLFVISSILSGIFSVYISFFVFKEWAFISVSVYLLSVAYNVVLKRSPLFGNIVMALLASFIPIVIMFFAKDCLSIINNEKINLLIYLYAGFPFLIIIPRELSLDISDMEGDKACGCRTLPIVIGAKKSKAIVVLFLLLTIVLSILLSCKYTYLMPVISLVDLFLIFYIYKLIKTETRIDYIRIGRFLWFTMIVGLIGFTVVTIY